jgi:hypothetical protein
MNTICRNTFVGSLATLVCVAAWAGRPHFVDGPTATRDGLTLTIEAKVAGLGDESQINAVATATAVCVNPGQNRPKAANKQDVAAEGDFPVQNGKAEIDLTLTASFQPDCSPPMTVSFTNVCLTVSGGSFTTFQRCIPGTF